MKRQGGFTLIEMIVVIVILGILAATAAPKFFDFSKDAKASALSGLAGAVNSGASIVYGKASLKGQLGATGTVDGVSLVYGYPDAAGIVSAVRVTDFETLTSAPAGYAIAWGYAKDAENCYVGYKLATSSAPAEAVVVSGSDCQ